MTRQPHDQFAKEYLQELLTPLGKVETSRDVKSEIREIDVWFVPTPSQTPTVDNLGLLSQMAATSCLFEPFRNAPNEIQIRNCMLKLYTVHGEVLRKTKREESSIKENELPFLWILTPTSSARIRQGFEAKPAKSGDWVKGVYFLPVFQRTAIVAINQLPSTPDTLWLRVLGNGQTQFQAVEELANLSRSNPLRDNLLEILASWRQTLQLKDNSNSNEEDRELIMNLSPAYLKQREAWVQEGVQEGQTLIVEQLLEGRFGTLDEELKSLIRSLVLLPQSERTMLLLNSSREELLARFKSESN
ncbi:hypothetical protein [Gloeocapsa sp. PCC 73106]|uniref:hypothetical protein n=1 Tax=Gloeocapsa sp. PCC 73106 TaxID=102232 RepID=UPI0002AC75CD|nr:hypothetical protein [Gloeocapsa sp. PCC 73106]ELR98581.1 hypothetical protein GLO73106DRAFT_00024150 [Gloeocapsa sp. PCC 73106]